MKVISKLLVALFFVGGSVYAQDRPGRGQGNMDPEEIVKTRTERMVKEHGLTNEQKEKVEALNRELVQQERVQRGSRDSRPSKEEMEKMQQARKERQEAYNVKLKEVLTPQQYEDYIKKEVERGKRENNRRNN